MKNNNLALTYGAIIGAISIILDLILYLVNPQLMGNFIVGSLSFIITIGLLYYTGIKARTELGGFISWKYALRVIWIAAMIGFIVTTGYKLVFAKYIDPSINKVAIEMQVKQLESMRGTLGDVKTDEAIDKVLNTDIFSMKYVVLIILGCVLFSFFIAAIIAALVMKNNPNAVFEKYEEKSEI